MAQSFNLNNFLQEYRSYNNRQYTAVENGKAAMEERAIKKAEEAVGNRDFLSLTLSEKLSELGIGKHVVQQIGDTAAGLVKDLVNPIGDYLEKYENIFDQSKYESEIQSYAKQMFFAKQALSADAKERIPQGQKFVLDM